MLRTVANCLYAWHVVCSCWHSLSSVGNIGAIRRRQLQDPPSRHGIPIDVSCLDLSTNRVRLWNRPTFTLFSAKVIVILLLSPSIWRHFRFNQISSILIARTLALHVISLAFSYHLFVSADNSAEGCGLPSDLGGRTGQHRGTLVTSVSYDLGYSPLNTQNHIGESMVFCMVKTMAILWHYDCPKIFRYNDWHANQYMLRVHLGYSDGPIKEVRAAENGRSSEDFHHWLRDLGRLVVCDAWDASNVVPFKKQTHPRLNTTPNFLAHVQRWFKTDGDGVRETN